MWHLNQQQKHCISKSYVAKQMLLKVSLKTMFTGNMAEELANNTKRGRASYALP